LKIFKKCRVTNVRKVAQLTEILKHKLQAKVQRIRRYKKRETQYIQNKCSKKTPKIYRNLGTKNTDARDPPSIAEVEPYWKSLWGDKAECNEGAEWIRRREGKSVIWIEGLYKLRNHFIFVKSSQLEIS